MADFNVHFDNPNDTHTKRLLQLFDALDILQLVSQPTHQKGHILDWVVTRANSGALNRLIQAVNVDHLQISDHFLV